MRLLPSWNNYSQPQRQTDSFSSLLHVKYARCLLMCGAKKKATAPLSLGNMCEIIFLPLSFSYVSAGLMFHSGVFNPMLGVVIEYLCFSSAHVAGLQLAQILKCCPTQQKERERGARMGVIRHVRLSVPSGSGRHSDGCEEM